MSLLFAMFGAGCTLVHPRDALPSPAPLEFLAWLCADTCRVEFAAADPLPYHAGAPATRRADGSFEIRYERRADGRWTPRAEGRLLAPQRAATAMPEHLRYEPASQLIGWSHPDCEVRVEVLATAAGPVIETAVAGPQSELVDTALRHLRAAVSFATALADRADTDDGLVSCCSRHAPWRAIRFLRAANRQQEAHRLVAARDALRAAAAIAPLLPELDLQIALLDRALGQDALVAARMRDASRHASDPAVRTLTAIAASDAGRRERHADSMELRAQSQLALEQGRVDTATALALAATAASPDPVADLQLRHRVQAARGDRFGMLGTALLLREYAADQTTDRMLASDFAQVGAFELASRAAARLLVDRLPTQDVLAAIRAASDQFARQAWFGWREAAGALASPPR